MSNRFSEFYYYGIRNSIRWLGTVQNGSKYRAKYYGEYGTSKEKLNENVDQVKFCDIYNVCLFAIRGEWTTSYMTPIHMVININV